MHDYRTPPSRKREEKDEAGTQAVAVPRVPNPHRCRVQLDWLINLTKRLRQGYGEIRLCRCLCGRPFGVLRDAEQQCGK